MAVKIMPKGTSLTAVTWSEGGQMVATLGYKGVLYNALDDAGYDIDYVGSQTAPGPAGVRDPHHEGISGSLVSDHLPTIGQRITTYQPDILMVELGANDAWWNTSSISTVMGQYRQLLTDAWAAKADLKVIAIKVAPLSPPNWPNAPGRRVEMNTGIAAEVAYWEGLGKTIVLGDFGSPSLQSDGVHWTTGGHQSAAANLLPTVKAVLDGEPPEPPPPATATWLSGAAASGGSKAGADGSWRTWVGGTYVQEMGGTWDDSSPEVQAAQWSTSPSGTWGTWQGGIDVAVGAIWKDLGESWAQAAAGAYDARWTTMFKNLASHRSGKKGPTYVRFAHEFNYDEMDWSVGPSEVADFITAFRRVRTLQLQHFPAGKLVWCPNDGTHTGIDVRTAMPGVEHFDVLGVDSYNNWPALNTTSALDTRFARTYSDGSPVGLEAWRLYAVSLGKKLAICEWGSNGDTASAGSGLDAPVFFDYFFDWLTTHAADISHEVYFNIADFGSNMYGLYPVTKQPNAAAAYKANWSTKPPAEGSAPPPPPPEEPTGETIYTNDGTTTAGLVGGLTQGGATIVPTAGKLRLTTGTGTYGAGQLSRRIVEPQADAVICATYTVGDTKPQEFWLGSRVENNLDGQKGYWLKIERATNSWALYSVTDYSGPALGTGTLSMTQGTVVYACLYTVGATIKARVALTAGTDWSVEATDTTHTAPGAVGFMFRAGQASAVADLDDFSVTNGSTEPTVPVSYEGTFETSSEGWTSNPAFGGYDVAPDPVRDTTRAKSGAASLKATWPAPGPAGKSWVNSQPFPITDRSQRHRMSADVYVPAGHPDVYLDVVFRARGATSSAKDQWVPLSVDFDPPTDPAAEVFVGVGTDAPVAGQNAWIDNVRVTPVPAGENKAPWIVTGPDLVVASGATVTLTGWRAGDPEMQPFVITWDGGGAEVVSGGDTMSPTLRFPKATHDAEFRPSVTVIDPMGGVATASVSVTVMGRERWQYVRADGGVMDLYLHYVSEGATT